MSQFDNDIQRRLTRLEDIQKIKDLKSKYAQFLDNGYDPDGIAGLFAEGGKWIIENKEITGKDAVKEQCRKLIKAQPWSFHNITPYDIHIDADGDHARGNFYVIALLTIRNKNGEDGAYILPGVFNDEFVKKGDQWFFSKVEAFIKQSAPWTEGWVRGGFSKGFFDLDK